MYGSLGHLSPYNVNNMGSARVVVVVVRAAGDSLAVLLLANTDNE